MRGARGEALPLVDARPELLAFAPAELDHLGNGLSESSEAGLVLPRREEPGGDPVEHGVDRCLLPFPQGGHGFGDLCQNAAALQPLLGDGVLSGRDGVQEMAVEFGDSQIVEMPDQRQEARLVRRHVGVRRPNKKGLIALVAAAVDQIGSFGVGAGDDKARNAHDVELEAGRV